MSQERQLPEELTALEATLASLKPRAASFDRLCQAFEAGYRAALAERHLPLPSGRGEGPDATPRGAELPPPVAELTRVQPVPAAGSTNVHPNHNLAPPPRRSWAWPAAFAAMSTVAAVLFVVVVLRPEPEPVVRYIERPAAVAPADPEALPAADAAPSEPMPVEQRRDPVDPAERLPAGEPPRREAPAEPAPFAWVSELAAALWPVPHSLPPPRRAMAADPFAEALALAGASPIGPYRSAEPPPAEPLETEPPPPSKTTAEWMELLHQRPTGEVDPFLDELFSPRRNRS